eukprot:6192963-Pleurochrysis_carterae.AAC.2
MIFCALFSRSTPLEDRCNTRVHSKACEMHFACAGTERPLAIFVGVRRSTVWQPKPFRSAAAGRERPRGAIARSHARFHLFGCHPR